MTRLITIDKEVQSGAPVFKGTRTPIHTLFMMMRSDLPMDFYLRNFPSVSKEQAIEAIAIAEKFLTSKKLASLYETLTRRKPSPPAKSKLLKSRLNPGPHELTL